MDTEITEPEEYYPNEDEDSQEPVLVLTPDYYHDEASIDVKVQLECPDISQSETNPDLSSTLTNSNFQPFTNILDETSPLITEVYSIHGGSGFDGNFENSNYSESPQQDEEEPSIHSGDEYQEIFIDPLSHNINASLSSPKSLDTGNPTNNFKMSSTSSLHSPVHIPSQNKNQKPKIRCSLCFGSRIFFVSTEFLNEHMKTVHNISNTNTNTSQSHEEIIPSEFSTKSATEISSTDSILQQTDRVQNEICNKMSKPEAEIEIIDVDDDELIKNQCCYCFNTFPSITELASHIKNYHEQNKFECTMCSLRRSAKHGPLLFVSMEFLNEHMKMVHNISSTNTSNNDHRKKRKLPPESDTPTYSNINENKTLSSTKNVSVNEATAPDDYLCEDCYKTFSNQQNLIAHTRRYHNKESFCDSCRKMFATQTELTGHFDRASLSKYFCTSRISRDMKLDCKVCFEPIESQCEVYIHTKCHLQSCEHPPGFRPKLREDPELKCDLCPRTFESELYFVSHKRLAHPNSNWQCSRCNKYFNSYFERKSHSCTPPFLRGRSRPKRLRQILYPADVVFVDIDDAEEDLISNNSDIGDNDNDSNSFQENGDEIEAEPIQIYMCDVCYKYFSVEEEFLLHLGVNHGRFFFCDDCQKSFAIKLDLDNHKNQNNSGNTVNVFCCQVCGESFSCECDSTIHQMQSHFKEIGRGLSKIWSTDISNYSPETNCFAVQITVPGTSPTLNDNRLQFYCDLCSSTFTSQCNLMDHRRLAHPSEKWKCYFSYTSKCLGSYEFDDYFDLKIHMKEEHTQQEKVLIPLEPVGTYSNNRFVTCEICFATFLTDAGLVCHKRKHHRS